MMDRQRRDAALAHLRTRQPFFWVNPDIVDEPADIPQVTARIGEARDRLQRAATLLRYLFGLPDAGHHPIHSPLIPVDGLQHSFGGAWFLKADHALPVAGSIKARGGFHEVLAHAERLAIENGLMVSGQDLIGFAAPAARELFARHSVVVGSTGNLGLSIGLCGAALGFETVVHMSADAKAWKKQRLRDNGARVVEHVGDYGEAVARGRELATRTSTAHFVDDERSVDLFSGFACAAYELRDQLADAGIDVDAEHPLVVYLPCGVGGAPGGITYGLKLMYGPHVHCVFAEPVESPCMLVQMLGGPKTQVSVYDVGLSNRTALDGLAVATASLFVAPLMRERLAGIYTIGDADAHDVLRRLHAAMGIRVEPSAATAVAGPSALRRVESALAERLSGATHVSWTTGGSLVPEREFQSYLAYGRMPRA